VRISQIYAGSGAGCTWSSKYVELFNSSGSPVDIGGWSVQYGSSTGSTFGSSTYNYVFIPAGKSIPACGYFLIKCATGANGTALPITPDIDASTSSGMSPSGTGGGKLAVFSDQVTNRTCAQAQAVAVDLVGWGSSTNCYETAVVPWTSGANTVVILRGSGGLTDNDNNSTDFTVVSATANPPRNTGSSANPDCHIVTPVNTNSWGRIKTMYR